MISASCTGCWITDGAVKTFALHISRQLFHVTSSRQIYYIFDSLSSACDKLENGRSYGGQIIHADPGHACEGRGLGVLSIGIINGKKTLLENNVSDLKQQTNNTLCLKKRDPDIINCNF